MTSVVKTIPENLKLTADLIENVLHGWLVFENDLLRLLMGSLKITQGKGELSTMLVDVEANIMNSR